MSCIKDLADISETRAPYVEPNVLVINGLWRESVVDSLNASEGSV